MLYIPIIFLGFGLITMASWTLPSLRDLWQAIWEADHVVKRGIRGAFFAFVTGLVLLFFGLGLFWLWELVAIIS